MPRNDTLEMGELTDTSFYILLCLTEKKHGYRIMQTIEVLTHNKVSIGPSSMYTTIRKLLDADLIMLVNKENDKKKTYITTDKGIELLQKDIKRRKQMIEQAEGILEKRKKV
ncbi:PadR family transcriptional regulator [Priestia megaterium]|uniref:PadR family transcriptional regulator n=1 Tax=Priestia megaterium TaxID=1404 RepID=UPI0025710BCA|nr:PadR family transcriptional regulator [Priestia megaterium]WJD83669.1 PadR family transcriptional regulator [Priestia megaterium]